jgi:hypothetical protein
MGFPTYTHPICDREKSISDRSAVALYLSAAAAAAAAATTSTSPSATPPQNKILCPLTRQRERGIRLGQEARLVARVLSRRHDCVATMEVSSSMLQHLTAGPVFTGANQGIQTMEEGSAIGSSLYSLCLPYPQLWVRT